MNRIKLHLRAMWDLIKACFGIWPELPEMADTRRVVPPMMSWGRVPMNVLHIHGCDRIMVLAVVMN